ncbi:hypothetical protein P3X46_000001 [Hevea brasiliensis]|uniref:FAD/NAD(P)-binding domain-containing protein n=1 Tax=Hevea brasiliensis TaxID=3981 RepID=A0ABQ9N8K8_HEVBR|nr:uncharacterized protein LOC110671725 isoform X2 [Hevea brasiliensis]KAJ9188621.1 hypothetical protein P3X46_000001 [Hevea brasiliensis]
MNGKNESGGERRRLVVIGGGIAGSLLAESLQFDVDVTLIDPKEYFEITWASLRAMVEPSFGKRSVINHRDYFTNGRIVTSNAINITDTVVLTAEGHIVPYDYLVIATGHAESVPKTRTARLAEYQAGEIAVDFPEKKVTLVHNGSRLMEFIGPKAADKTLKWLRSKNVDVKLEQRVDLNSIPEVDENGSRIYHSLAGETIKADCHFLCAGKPLGSAWLKDTVLKNNLDFHGRLVVDEYLRVKGRKNIFAIGDITNIPEIKQGYLAQKHAEVAAGNLKLLMAGGKECKMAAYKPDGSVTAIVSLGRRDAVAQFPFITIIGLIPGMIKSGDLFVGKTRKQRGLEPHVV